MLFDTHAHIDYFSDPKTIVEQALEADVLKMVLPGVEPAKFAGIISLIEEYDCIYGALGVHPSDVDKFETTTAKQIANLATHPKIVALGEIGLDYYWDKDNKEKQKEVFKTQLEIAKALNLPVIVHNRDAHLDTIEILKKYEMKNVIMHCFSGSLEFARECVKLGWLLGIGGVVTFKNAKVVKEVVKEILLENLVLETDCPYLAPHPFRGEENSPKYLTFIAKEIANIKDIPISLVQEVTTENALKFFNIKEPTT